MTKLTLAHKNQNEKRLAKLSNKLTCLPSYVGHMHYSNYKQLSSLVGFGQLLFSFLYRFGHFIFPSLPLLLFNFLFVLFSSSFLIRRVLWIRFRWMTPFWITWGLFIFDRLRLFYTLRSINLTSRINRGLFNRVCFLFGWRRLNFWKSLRESCYSLIIYISCVLATVYPESILLNILYMI